MADRTRLTIACAAVLAVVVAVGVVLFVVLGDDAPAEAECPERSRLEEVSTTPELVPRDELTPAGTVGEERQPAVDSVEALGLGPVVSGRFYDGGAAPAAVPLDADVLLAAAPTTVDSDGSFTAVTLPSGEPLWRRTFTGAAPGGGMVGERFVAVLGGQAPLLLALDPENGERIGCVEVPTAGEQTPVVAEQAGAEVATAAGSPVQLALLDPVAGPVWQREPGGPVRSVDAFGDLLVAGRVAHDPVALVQGAAAAQDEPWLTAYAAGDGAPSWTSRDPMMAAGVDTGSGRLVVLTAAAQQEPAMGLAALGADGTVGWEVPLPKGYWDASIAAGVVVVRGGGPDGARLLLHSLEDGRRLGVVDAPEGDQRRGFGAATAVDGRLLVPDPAGATWVSPLTGRSRHIDTSETIDAVTVVGDWTLVTVGGGILVAGPMDETG